VRSAYLVNQHWFNAADGHPLLPPSTATWMAWLVAWSTRSPVTRTVTPA
jgi:hypothetical protein